MTKNSPQASAQQSNTNPPSDKGEMSREEYLAEREHLESLVTDSTKSFDTTLVTLAAGGLVLSIGFVEQIAPHPIKIWSLISAWITLALSLFLTLTSFYISKRSLEVEVEINQKRYEGNAYTKDNCISEFLSNLTEIMNITSLIAFTLGIIFLVLFSISNIIA